MIQKIVRGRQARARMVYAKSVYAELKTWLGRCYPHAMDPSIESACLLKSISLEVAEQELASLREIITKAKALPYRNKILQLADNAEKSAHAEIETMRNLKDAVSSRGIDPVPMDKCLARARD